MTTALSSIVSEFDTVERERRYDAWLKAEVAASHVEVVGVVHARRNFPGEDAAAG
ncbi:MAG: hypothetical protein QM772_11550 [Ottowia sp.]|uniref:hypothetical protein n=1 Tax=Ottowia sp. TaxID=1898956 RepID=UPI0039E27CB9